jgi:hypothetical protein
MFREIQASNLALVGWEKPPQTRFFLPARSWWGGVSPAALDSWATAACGLPSNG